MAPATKEEAKKKVATMVVGVGYPDTLARLFRRSTFAADDAFGNLRARAAVANTATSSPSSASRSTAANGG